MRKFSVPNDSHQDNEITLYPHNMIEYMVEECEATDKKLSLLVIHIKLHSDWNSEWDYALYAWGNSNKKAYSLVSFS